MKAISWRMKPIELCCLDFWVTLRDEINWWISTVLSLVVLISPYMFVFVSCVRKGVYEKLSKILIKKSSPSDVPLYITIVYKFQ